ncbi:hypothetical protein CsatB_009534 [Cannabis sativa]
MYKRSSFEGLNGSHYYHHNNKIYICMTIILQKRVICEHINTYNNIPISIIKLLIISIRDTL